MATASAMANRMVNLQSLMGCSVFNRQALKDAKYEVSLFILTADN